MRYDVAVVGAGVLGLAHAYHLAQRGLKVIVLERDRRAQSASIRNFGMLWPIGQPSGDLYQLASRSLQIWLNLLSEANIWHDRCGSLHVAHEDDEAQVLREFAERDGRPLELLQPAQVMDRFPAINPVGLKLAMFSPSEVQVDPRVVIGTLPGFLKQRYGVDFAFESRVLRYDAPRVETVSGDYQADRLLICTGADFRELAPKAFADSGLVACKLQMMRTSPMPGYRIRTMYAGGLTLKHYKAFATCPTFAQLTHRIEKQYPDYVKYGIHVMASQHESGEITLGDSHEYGSDIEPFDKSVIDDLVLAYLEKFLIIPNRVIASRWSGIYAKHPTKPYLVAEPRERVLAVTGVGGNGMTLSFGLAEKTVSDWLGANA